MFSVKDWSASGGKCYNVSIKYMFNKIIKYVGEAQAELKKVVWPSKKEVTQYSLLVIGISLAVALFLGVIDYGISELIGLVFK